jgi:hypothetical protein
LWASTKEIVMKPVKKIGTATVYGVITKQQVADLEKGHMQHVASGATTPEPTIPIMRLTGMVIDIKRGQGDNGPWVALLGEFTAVSRKTGEIFQSAKAFIPGAINDLIAARMMQEGTRAVEFAVDVSIQWSKGSLGYEYINHTLIKDDENASPSMRLMRLVQESAPIAELADKSTPAPAPAPVPTPEPAAPPASRAAKKTPAKK